MTGGQLSRLRRGISRGLILSGLGCLMWTGGLAIHARAFDREQRRVIAAVKNRSESVPTTATSDATAPVPLHGLVGILDIPRLGLSEVVAEGDDDTTLNMAIGHLPDTPLPWQSGNSALAGHRNTHFGPLKSIRSGDRMTLSTPRGDFMYSVRRVVIVSPQDLSVLAPTTTRSLTLITCYPFQYIGHAPQRFVIQADAVE
jgi:sortase A